MARDIGAAAAFLAHRVPGVPGVHRRESMGAALSVHAAAQGHLFGVAGLVLVGARQVRRIAYALATRALQSLGARADVFVERVNSDDLSADGAIRLLADPLGLAAHYTSAPGRVGAARRNAPLTAP